MESQDNTIFTLAGFTLNTEERAVLFSSMSIKKAQEKLPNIYLWGKVIGIQQDYFLAQSVGETLFDRKYFYTTDNSNWFQLPLISPNESHQADLVQARFYGDPSYEHTIPGGLLNCAKKKRLTALMETINRNVQIVPRGAYYRNLNRAIIKNPNFRGLSSEDMGDVNSFLHFRDGFEITSRTISERVHQFDDAIDIFEPISKDEPKGVWSVNFEIGSAATIVRNLQWPGYTFMHTTCPLRYSSFYYGTGQKNHNIGFMLIRILLAQTTEKSLELSESTQVENDAKGHLSEGLPLLMGTVRERLTPRCKCTMHSPTRINGLIDRLCKKRIIAVFKYTPEQPGSLSLYYSPKVLQQQIQMVSINTPSKPAIVGTGFSTARKMTSTTCGTKDFKSPEFKSLQDSDFGFQSASEMKSPLSHTSMTHGKTVQMECNEFSSAKVINQASMRKATSVHTTSAISITSTTMVSHENSEFQSSRRIPITPTDPSDTDLRLDTRMSKNKTDVGDTDSCSGFQSARLVAEKVASTPLRHKLAISKSNGVELDSTPCAEAPLIDMAPVNLATPTKVPVKRKSTWNTPFKSPIMSGAISAKKSMPPARILSSQRHTQTPVKATTITEAQSEASLPSRVPVSESGQMPVSTLPHSFSTPKAKMQVPSNSKSFSSRPIRTPLSMRTTNHDIPITPVRGGLASGKKPFQSPLLRADPALREKKELDRSIEELIDLKRKYQLYLTYKENNEIAKVDSLISKWKGVCQDVLVDMRARIGEVSIPRKEQSSNPFFDRPDHTRGFGIHPKHASSWCDKFADDEEGVNGDSFDTHPTHNDRPRALRLVELANMCQFDIHLIGKYDTTDDNFM
ncbi:hypothetical protein BSLG_007165 [Batrachochytrium salamandrivorans]|nr:hypothetical protein BSLG_007165 [Batrachochytrium salamandrivorans]